MGKRKKTAIFCRVFAAFWFLGAVADGRELHLPSDLGMSMPVQLKISGIFVEADTIWIFPHAQSFLIKLPFVAGGKSRTEVYGRSEQQIRMPISGSAVPGRWRGMFMMGEQLVVWDATMLQLLVLRKKDLTPVRSNTIPVDVLRPASDRGGEATRPEILSLRKKFKNTFVKTDDPRFTGLAEIPNDWTRTSGRSFLISTRLKGFPLLLMNCDADDSASCIIARRCNLEGESSFLNENSTGIAINLARRDVLMANSKTNTIEVFKFESCGSVKRHSELTFSPKMPKIENIHVDSANRLWIGTGILDAAVDANLFYWEKGDWN